MSKRIAEFKASIRKQLNEKRNESDGGDRSARNRVALEEIAHTEGDATAASTRAVQPRKPLLQKQNLSGDKTSKWPTSASRTSATNPLSPQAKSTQNASQFHVTEVESSRAGETNKPIGMFAKSRQSDIFQRKKARPARSKSKKRTFVETEHEKEWTSSASKTKQRKVIRVERTAEQLLQVTRAQASRFPIHPVCNDFLRTCIELLHVNESISERRHCLQRTLRLTDT